jgi:hypothetical protein
VTADEATRRVLWAGHTAAQTRLELIRAERNDARRNALDEALAPLLEVVAGLRTSAERDALAVYILRRIQNAWRPPRVSPGQQRRYKELQRLRASTRRLRRVHDAARSAAAIPARKPRHQHRHAGTLPRRGLDDLRGRHRPCP